MNVKCQKQVNKRIKLFNQFFFFLAFAVILLVVVITYAAYKDVNQS